MLSSRTPSLCDSVLTGPTGTTLVDSLDHLLVTKDEEPTSSSRVPPVTSRFSLRQLLHFRKSRPSLPLPPLDIDPTQVVLQLVNGCASSRCAACLLRVPDDPMIAKLSPNLARDYILHYLENGTCDDCHGPFVSRMLDSADFALDCRMLVHTLRSPKSSTTSLGARYLLAFCNLHHRMRYLLLQLGTEAGVNVAIARGASAQKDHYLAELKRAIACPPFDLTTPIVNALCRRSWVPDTIPQGLLSARTVAFEDVASVLYHAPRSAASSIADALLTDPEFKHALQSTVTMLNEGHLNITEILVNIAPILSLGCKAPALHSFLTSLAIESSLRSLCDEGLHRMTPSSVPPAVGAFLITAHCRQVTQPDTLWGYVLDGTSDNARYSAALEALPSLYESLSEQYLEDADNRNLAVSPWDALWLPMFSAYIQLCAPDPSAAPPLTALTATFHTHARFLASIMDARVRGALAALSMPAGQQAYDMARTPFFALRGEFDRAFRGGAHGYMRHPHIQRAVPPATLQALCARLLDLVAEGECADADFVALARETTESLEEVRRQLHARGLLTPQWAAALAPPAPDSGAAVSPADMDCTHIRLGLTLGPAGATTRIVEVDDARADFDTIAALVALSWWLRWVPHADVRGRAAEYAPVPAWVHADGRRELIGWSTACWAGRMDVFSVSESDEGEVDADTHILCAVHGAAVYWAMGAGFVDATHRTPYLAASGPHLRDEECGCTRF